MVKDMEYTITDFISKETFLCREDEPLLSSMKRNHKGPIQYGCGGGGCGVCKIQVLEGEYIAFKNMSKAHVSDDDKKENIVLSCCIKPLSDLTIKKYSQ